MKSKNPAEWGGDYWYFVHGLAWWCQGFRGSLGRRWLSATPAILPCDTCDRNFATYIRRNSLEHFQDREEFGRWLNGAHNDVNRQIGKPHVAWSVHVAEFSANWNHCRWHAALLSTLRAVFSQYEVEARDRYVTWISGLIDIVQGCDSRLANRLYLAFFQPAPGYRWCDAWQSSQCLLGRVELI